MVWGLGVGYVISGNYFGWNLGLAQGGTLGLGIATFFAILLYVTFTFSYAEMACAIPKAGGAFDYANRTWGEDIGFVAGMAQNIEFLFAPPAIAFGIGSYLNLFFPVVPVIWFSILAYFIFTALNIYGIKAAATFELVVTMIALAGILLFAFVMFPQIKLENLTVHALPFGWSGIFAAVPFAIWFFLGIEGVANLAEETLNPTQTMSRGFLAALFTLVAICLLTFTSSVGAGGWEAIVYKPDGSLSDAPLPMAMALTGTSGITYQLLIIVGIFGLMASLNGLMLAGGRSTYEFGKLTFGDVHIGQINPRFQTPAFALLFNMVIGIAALLTGRTGELITLSVFGALTLYGVSMIAMMALRKKEPLLARPFRSPGYPYFPIIALCIAAVAIVAMGFYNPMLSLLYVLLMFGCYGIFKARKLWKR